MAGDTKERILETALELFAQSGYLGTSMSDIAKELGITKGALYKHYTSKQEILNSIVERMNKMDYERAEEYEMPETEPDGFAEAYLQTPIEKIRTYSMAQFDHDLHHEEVDAVQLFDIKVPLECEQRNVYWNSCLFSHAFRLRSGLPHADSANRSDMITLSGFGIAFNGTCRDPAEVNDLGAFGNGILCIGK